MPSLLNRRRKDNEPGEPATPAAAKGGAATATATVRDFLLVTYAVPEARVRPHVPDGLTLDRLPGPDGDPVAFVQTLCAYHEDARWSPLPGSAGQSFHQVTYRVLTRREGKPGAWVMRTFVSASELHLSRRAIHREADYARFSLYIDGDPAKGTYRSYSVRAVGDLGVTQLDVRALPETPAVPAPFGKREDMIAFLTQRDENYFRASAPKNGTGLVPTRHDALAPLDGELTAARLTPWTDDLKVLTADDLLKPLAVHIQPSLTQFSYPPRLVRLGAPAPPAAPASTP